MAIGWRISLNDARVVWVSTQQNGRLPPELVCPAEREIGLRSVKDERGFLRASNEDVGSIPGTSQ
jgi:hypothetical protein